MPASRVASHSELIHWSLHSKYPIYTDRCSSQKHVLPAKSRLFGHWLESLVGVESLKGRSSLMNRRWSFFLGRSTFARCRSRDGALFRPYEAAPKDGPGRPTLREWLSVFALWAGPAWPTRPARHPIRQQTCWRAPDPAARRPPPPQRAPRSRAWSARPVPFLRAFLFPAFREQIKRRARSYGDFGRQAYTCTRH